MKKIFLAFIVLMVAAGGAFADYSVEPQQAYTFDIVDNETAVDDTTITLAGGLAIVNDDFALRDTAQVFDLPAQLYAVNHSEPLTARLIYEVGWRS